MFNINPNEEINFSKKKMRVVKDINKILRI